MSIKHYLAFLGLLAAIGMSAGAAMEKGASAAEHGIDQDRDAAVEPRTFDEVPPDAAEESTHAT